MFSLATLARHPGLGHKFTQAYACMGLVSLKVVPTRLAEYADLADL